MCISKGPTFFLFQVLDPRDKNLVDVLVSAAVASGESGVTLSPSVLKHLKEC